MTAVEPATKQPSSGDEVLSVGFVGLGAMGAGMVRSLLAGGIQVAVYDVDQQAVAALVEAGASAAGPLQELAATHWLIHIAVSDDAAAEDVVRPLVAAMPQHGVIAIHSTISVRLCRSLAADAAQRSINILDVAMTGGSNGAAAGRLTFMVGGDQDAFERARPVLARMSEHIFHMGPSGAGLIAKLADNVVARLCILGVIEGLRLAEAAGLDLDLVEQAIRVGSGNLGALDQWAALRQMVGTYPAGADRMAALMYKNGTLGLEAAHDLRVALPGAALARELTWDVFDLARAADGAPR